MPTFKLQRAFTDIRLTERATKPQLPPGNADLLAAFPGGTLQIAQPGFKVHAVEPDSADQAVHEGGAGKHGGACPRDAALELL